MSTHRATPQSLVERTQRLGGGRVGEHPAVEVALNLRRQVTAEVTRDA